MISETLLSLRKELKLSRRMLAEKSGVSADSIKQYESGRRTPRIEQLRMLADALGVSMASLLGCEHRNGEVDLVLAEIEIQKLGYTPEAARAISDLIFSIANGSGSADEYMLGISNITGLTPNAVKSLANQNQKPSVSHDMAMRAFSEIISSQEFPMLLTKINTYLYDYSDGITFSFDVEDEDNLPKEQKEQLLESIRESLPAGQFLDILRAIKAENEHR